MADQHVLKGDVKQEQAHQCAELRLADNGQQEAGQDIPVQAQHQCSRLAQTVGGQGDKALPAQFGDADHGRGAGQRGDLQPERVLQPDAENQIDQLIPGTRPHSNRDARQGRDMPEHCTDVF